MREIKFRAWLIGLNCMVNWDAVKDIKMEKALDWGTRIPMQYTGLKDKKGVEIYEGDIIDYYYVVEWDSAAASYILTDIEEKIYCMELSEKTGVEEHGITGNIYETPELNNKG